MKKNLATVICFLFFVIAASSQITKNNWLVGGTISFASSNAKNDASKNATTEFTFSPQAGYFFIDKLTAGIKTDITASKQHLYNNFDYYSSGTIYAFGPFARYYFLSPEKMVNVFFEAGDQYRIVASKDTPSSISNAINLAAGPVIFLNSSVAVEWSIGYSWLNSVKNSAGFRNTIQTGIGLQIHLEKE